VGGHAFGEHRMLWGRPSVDTHASVSTPCCKHIHIGYEGLMRSGESETSSNMSRREVLSPMS